MFKHTKILSWCSFNDVLKALFHVAFVWLFLPVCVFFVFVFVFLFFLFVCFVFVFVLILDSAVFNWVL